jgi:hypothetical protein
MGYPPLCAPGGLGRKSCGQGPSQPRPDGAGQFVGPVDEDVLDNNDDDEEDDKTSSDRWVPGSGLPGSFCLAWWGPLGLWHLWFPCITAAGYHGRPLCFQAYPDLGIFSVPLSLGAVPNDRRGFIWQLTVSPSTSGSICVIWVTLRRRRLPRLTWKMTVVHGGTLPRPHQRKSGSPPFLP